MVHDIEDQFRLVWLKPEEGLKPSKESYKSHLKGMLTFFSVTYRWLTHTLFTAYIKKLNKRVAETKSEDELKAWQEKVKVAMKKLTSNYDNYDLLMGESMNGDAMYVLIDFREDGVTPYATVWADGLREEKV
jgi:hypothetical protein